MIAFGCSVTKPEVFERCAAPGLRRAAEAGSEIDAIASVGSIFASYNTLLDRWRGREDLEALVLVHQDAELVDADFCATLRDTLSDPLVAIVGCVGAVGVRSIAWWEGSVTCASFVHRYGENGGGDLPSVSWSWEDAPAYARVGEVDTVDGFILALSPWAVRELRFDESLGQFHGYDLDLCLQARVAGRKVVTADFRAIHHRGLEILPDPDEWVDAYVRVQDKWEGRLGIGEGVGSFEERALRAAAEADAAMLVARMNELETIARQRELQRALAGATDSISWQITAPLRRLAATRQGR